MHRRINLEIPGRPIAKQRARARGGQFYTPAATRNFEDMVAFIARAVPARDLSGEISVEIAIRTRRALRGDVDNYAKSILDGIVKGGLLRDDREITSLCISKNLAVADEDDRTFVEIELLRGR